MRLIRPSFDRTPALVVFCLVALLCSLLLYTCEAREQEAAQSSGETGKETAQESPKDTDKAATKARTQDTVRSADRVRAKSAVEDTAKAVKRAYVGVSTCKMCHMPYFKAWSGTPHAAAFQALNPEKEESTSPGCLKCHTTGFGDGGYETGKKTSDFTGVQCESCHGPGADYRNMSVMKNLEEAMAAGLTHPVTESVCARCHNKESPSFEGFDFEKYMAKGVHEVERKTEKQTEE